MLIESLYDYVGYANSRKPCKTQQYCHVKQFCKEVGFLFVKNDQFQAERDQVCVYVVESECEYGNKLPHVRQEKSNARYTEKGKHREKDKIGLIPPLPAIAQQYVPERRVIDRQAKNDKK